MNPKISIIVPIYNVEKYLEKCISSLLNQTFSNFELILVNDGSPDNCGNICDSFKEKDSRIKVLHLENGGVCRARNKGMEIASGDFYAFVDSDDWVEENYIKDFAEHIVDDETVIIQNAIRDKNDTCDSNFFGFEDESFILEEDFATMITKNIYYLPQGFPWNKLYSRKIIEANNLKFDPAIKLGDDEKWNFEYFRYAKKVVFVSRAYYHYQYNPTSISNQARPFERELLRYKFRTEYFNFVIKNYKQKDLLKKLLTKEAEEFFRICILDRIYKNKLKQERISQLKAIYSLGGDSLSFLQSPLFFRKIDYFLLRNGFINLFDFFKSLRMKINK